jgi:4-hydroxythreonine-4-phosphate dehydrogenase
MIGTTEAPVLSTIGVTMGDPAGVGPEVIVKALSDPKLQQRANYLVIGSVNAMEQAAVVAGSSLQIIPARDIKSWSERPNVLHVLDVGGPVPGDLRLGHIDGRAGALALAYIRRAAKMALENVIDAIVTAPVNKEAVELSGEHFTGHTELLAELTGASRVSMLLVTGLLRVAHVSTHVSLSRAIELVQPDRIIRVVELVVPALQLLGIPEPRIAVAGLNPHAGEHGLFGSEEPERIVPAVVGCQSRGWNVSGPYPPDSIFHRARQGEFDAVIAMYHDQGHVAVKMSDFFGGVNVTLGLPIVRTSVDHGTGFDIAGKGVAKPDSMIAALDLAITMAHRSSRAKYA